MRVLILYSALALVACQESAPQQSAPQRARNSSICDRLALENTDLLRDLLPDQRALAKAEAELRNCIRHTALELMTVDDSAKDVADAVVIACEASVTRVMLGRGYPIAELTEVRQSLNKGLHQDALLAVVTARTGNCGAQPASSVQPE